MNGDIYYQISNPSPSGQMLNMYQGIHYFIKRTKDINGKVTDYYGGAPKDLAAAKKALNAAKKEVNTLNEQKSDLLAQKAGNKIIQYSNAKYVGKVNKKGQENGKGKMIWKNGDVYEGDWKNGKRTGKGKLTWKNGDKYEGYFKNDELDGEGTLEYSNGDIEVGIWKNGELTEEAMG